MKEARIDISLSPDNEIKSQKYDELKAEFRKGEIARPVRPTKGILTLPSGLTSPRRVLLIVPPSTREEQVGRLSGAMGELPMLGLAYIASSLRDQGNVVKVIDYEIEGTSLDQVAGDVCTFSPDIVGMTAYITNMRRCAALAEIVKGVNINIKVMLGGPQVTIFPEEAFKSPHIDMIVLSEGEIIVRNLMNALDDEEKLSQVRGVYFRNKNGEIIRNQREVLVDDLDIFPSPATDLFPMQKYFPPVYIRGRKVAHLLTSRGCPFECTFCETKLTFGRSFRYHSTDRVLEELETLIESGYDAFQFYDDIFTANKKRVIALCEGIIERGFKIQWMCYSRTNTLSEDMLALMKQAGCYMISYGFESADNQLLEVIKKNLTVETHREGIRLTKNANIQIAGTFMLGLPTETPAQTAKTIDFALNSGIDYAIFGLTEPYPGTELWEDTEKYGFFDTSGRYQNNLLSENAAVWIPNGRDRDELKAQVEKAMFFFYVHPRSIRMLLGNFIRLPFNRAVRFIWAGFVFFVIGRFKRRNPNHMTSRN